MIKVFIDPGHGGTDPGAVANNIREKDINLVVGLELRKLLIDRGLEVLMSRESDINVGLNDRCSMANGWGADVFVSIHHNAGGGDGFEIIHTIHTEQSVGDDIAKFIQKEFALLGQNLRRIYGRESTNYPGQDYYTVIQGTNMPALITEYCFLDNIEDVKNVDTYQELIDEATAIYNGLCAYYGIAIVKPISNEGTINLLKASADILAEENSKLKAKLDTIRKAVLEWKF